MNPIRKLFSKTSETFRNLIKRFPVTLAVILFASIFLTVGIDYNINLLEKVILFCTIFSIESFPTFFILPNPKRILPSSTVNFVLLLFISGFSICIPSDLHSSMYCGILSRFPKKLFSVAAMNSAG